MIGIALSRAIAQMGDSRFLKVLVIALVLAVATLLVAIWGAGYFATYFFMPDDPWLGFAIRIAAYFIAAWLGFLMFVPLSALFVGFFLDDVVDAVEDRHYPDRKASIHIGTLGSMWLGARFGAIVVLINLAVVPLYIVFFWVPFLPVAIFWLVNAYLLAWGFHDLVSQRHMSIPDARQQRRGMRGDLLIMGLIMAALFTIPIINIAAPVLAAAMMVHVFHAKTYGPIS